MAQTERVTAIVLDRVPYEEHDRLYTLLTLEHGLIRARARGASKPKAKVRPHVEGFGVVDIMLVRGRAGYILASAEMVEPLRIATLEARLLADAARKTIARIMREEEGEGEIFEMLKKLLFDIAAHQSDTTTALFAREIHFYWSLLGELGYNGSLEKCSACHKNFTGTARFVPMAGTFFCETCAKSRGTSASDSLRGFLGKPYTGNWNGRELAEFSHALAEHFQFRLEIAYPSIFI
ncbi:MAG: DNA repair protein RecO [bacterium]